MIYDVFLYAGEKNMLNARIATMQDLDVTHIAVVANRTHQGDVVEYPTAAEEAHERVLVDLSEFDGIGRGGAGFPGYQVRERHHRDYAMFSVLRQATDTDLILLSDIDEIPRPELVGVVTPEDIAQDGVLCLAMRMHPWEPYWLYPGPWLGTTITTRGNVERNAGLQWMRDARGTDACQVLGLNDGDGPDGLRGGWHLSWWGSDKMRRWKLASFSHAELADRADTLAECARRGVDINGVPLTLVSPRDLDWPEGLFL